MLGELCAMSWLHLTALSLALADRPLTSFPMSTEQLQNLEGGKHVRQIHYHQLLSNET